MIFSVLIRGLVFGNVQLWLWNKLCWKKNTLLDLEFNLLFCDSNCDKKKMKRRAERKNCNFIFVITLSWTQQKLFSLFISRYYIWNVHFNKRALKIVCIWFLYRWCPTLILMATLLRFFIAFSTQNINSETNRIICYIETQKKKVQRKKERKEKVWLRDATISFCVKWHADIPSIFLTHGLCSTECNSHAWLFKIALEKEYEKNYVCFCFSFCGVVIYIYIYGFLFSLFSFTCLQWDEFQCFIIEVHYWYTRS